MTNIQPAVGCAQLERLDEYIAAKREIAKRYTQAFVDLPGIEVAPEAAWAFSISWLYTIRVDEEKYGLDSRGLMEKLADAGIESRPLWEPLQLNPAHCRGTRHGLLGRRGVISGPTMSTLFGWLAGRPGSGN